MYHEQSGNLAFSAAAANFCSDVYTKRDPFWKFPTHTDSIEGFTWAASKAVAKPIGQVVGFLQTLSPVLDTKYLA